MMGLHNSSSLGWASFKLICFCVAIVGAGLASGRLSGLSAPHEQKTFEEQVTAAQAQLTVLDRLRDATIPFIPSETVEGLLALVNDLRLLENVSEGFDWAAYTGLRKFFEAEKSDPRERQVAAELLARMEEHDSLLESVKEYLAMIPVKLDKFATEAIQEADSISELEAEVASMRNAASVWIAAAEVSTVLLNLSEVLESKRLAQVWSSDGSKGWITMAKRFGCQTGELQKSLADSLESIRNLAGIVSSRLREEKLIPLIVTTSETAEGHLTRILVGTNAVRSGTPQSLGAARGMADSSQVLIDGYTDVLAAWKRLEPIFANTDQVTFAEEATRTFESNLSRLRIAVADLVDHLSGDLSQMVTQRIQLHYFRDVQRLMFILNPSTRANSFGVGDTASRIDILRNAIEESEFDMLDGMAALANSQDLILRLRGEQVVLAGTVKSKVVQKESDSVALRSLETEIAIVESALNTVANRLSTLEEQISQESDTAKKAALQTKLNSAKAEQAQHQREQARLSAQRTRAQARVDQSQTELNKAEAALATIRGELTKTEKDLASNARLIAASRRSRSLNSVEETRLFAALRDNQPILYALGSKTANDPIRRVHIFGFADSMILIVRGMKEDVRYVEDLISEYDRPTGQAKLGLWILQVNVQQDEKGMRKFNEATEKVSETLSTLRRTTDALLSSLRQCVTDQVEQARKDAAKSKQFEHYFKYFAAGNVESKMLSDLEPTIQRWNFFHDEFLSGLLFSPTAKSFSTRKSELVIEAKGKLLDDEESRLRRRFDSLHATSSQNALATPANDQRKEPNDELVTQLCNTLQQLGADDSSFQPRIDELVRQLTSRDLFSAAQLIPDPARNTTLGENLLLLHLAKPKYRDAAICNFLKIADPVLEEGQSRLVEKGLPGARSATKNFTRLQSTMGYRRVGANVLTHAQSELLTAIQLVGTFRGLLQFGDTSRFYGDIYLRLKDQNARQQYAKDFVAELELQAKKTQYPRSGARQMEGWQGVLPTSPGNGPLGENNDQYEANREGSRFSRQGRNARVSAANELLKELIKAVEEDLYDHLGSHAVRKLRTDLTDRGLNVTSFDRTQVLSTNRIVARADVGGSAQLGLGEEVNALEAVQQAFALVSAAQTGPQGLLGGLRSLPNEQPRQELYGVGTGGTFKVTPVFEPSGQSVRFMFDYVSSTLIREPNGTVNALLPRIDRHAINTEVQISNLEVRDISQFEANVQLGRPSKKTGGLPILKDIPILSDLPIIGWFSKSRGKAAVSQVSIILGQSVVYPTIEDMLNLLTTELEPNKR